MSSEPSDLLEAARALETLHGELYLIGLGERGPLDMQEIEGFIGNLIALKKAAAEARRELDTDELIMGRCHCGGEIIHRIVVTTGKPGGEVFPIHGPRSVGSEQTGSGPSPQPPPAEREAHYHGGEACHGEGCADDAQKEEAP